MDGIFFVYILKGAKGRYIGCTTDIQKRIRQHNEGFSRYTKNRGPWAIEWISKSMSHTDALILEKKIKRQKGGAGLQQIMREFGS